MMARKDTYVHTTIRGAKDGMIRVEVHKKPLFNTPSDHILLLARSSGAKPEDITRLSMRDDEAVKKNPKRKKVR